MGGEDSKYCMSRGRSRTHMNKSCGLSERTHNKTLVVVKTGRPMGHV